MRENKRNNKLKMTAVIAVMLVCILAIGGTIAYLTSHSRLANTFTVGEIAPIDPDGSGPDGNENIDKDDTKLQGNLYEPHWVDDSKLFPTAVIPKDPYVGVGKGSESCAVYVYVTNEMANNHHIYFEKEEGWNPVAGCVYEVTVGDKTYYEGGLFEYTAGLDGSKATGNVWTTTPLFKNVIISDEADADDFKLKEGITTGGKPTITVHSYLHQKQDANGADIEKTIIENAAKAKFGIN